MRAVPAVLVLPPREAQLPPGCECGVSSGLGAPGGAAAHHWVLWWCWHCPALPAPGGSTGTGPRCYGRGVPWPVTACWGGSVTVPGLCDPSWPLTRPVMARAMAVGQHSVLGGQPGASKHLPGHPSSCPEPPALLGSFVQPLGQQGQVLSGWIMLVATWFRCRLSCKEQDPYRSLPTWDILWSCELRALSGQPSASLGNPVSSLVLLGQPEPHWVGGCPRVGVLAPQ